MAGPSPRCRGGHRGPPPADRSAVEESRCEPVPHERVVAWLANARGLAGAHCHSRADTRGERVRSPCRTRRLRLPVQPEMKGGFPSSSSERSWVSWSPTRPRPAEARAHRRRSLEESPSAALSRSECEQGGCFGIASATLAPALSFEHGVSGDDACAQGFKANSGRGCELSLDRLP